MELKQALFCFKNSDYIKHAAFDKYLLVNYVRLQNSIPSIKEKLILAQIHCRPLQGSDYQGDASNAY